jgi:hypothetical protein
MHQCHSLTQLLLVELSIDLARVSTAHRLVYISYSSSAYLTKCTIDLYTVDEKLMGTLQSYLVSLFEVISTIVIITWISPVFAFCLIPIIIYYLKEQAFFTVSILIEATHD